MPPEDSTLRPASQPGSEFTVTAPALEGLRQWVVAARADDLDGLAAVTQLDDAGANTANLYEWQAAMATADGLALYRDALDEQGVLDPGCDDYILCEWHEDWVVGSGDLMQLVSGKHRSPDVGAYTTVNKLADDGGVAHLFNRWFALGKKPMCRLVTTGGLKAGPARELKTLTARLRTLKTDKHEQALTPDETRVVKQLRTAIATYDKGTAERWKGANTYPAVEEKDQDREVTDFLASLTIVTVVMNQGVVGDAAPSKYVKPVLEKMSHAVVDSAAVWKAVLGLFRARMQSHGETTYGDLPVVLQRDHSGGLEPDVRRRIARRLVTLGDIQIAIETALAIPGAYQSVAPVATISRVEIKMAQSGCSSNAVSRATALRMEYEEYWRDQESGDPGARVARKNLERLLRRVSDHAMGDSELSGHGLWTAVDDKLVELQEAGELPAGVDSEIALGGLCDLSNRCQIWFGPTFDIDAVIAGRRSEGVTQP
ncbi:hypothetical protein [Amycolatopsis sp. H20-H5]|uniref:hypothetical protein n=1 Tax=Amycolatopsis sp. H20-H5 TaxID=3046309 RepID=UPI002DB991B7|nr:hypothetical protein [Amycolatopsis sp. H20-H5]MEC3977417.1 hypothetical protein [Amycolatopsis sp. H20-H5]